MTLLVVRVVSSLGPETLAAITLLSALALAVGFRQTRQTTLRAAWGWAAASWLTLVGVEVAVTITAEAADWINPARYLAAVTTFAPLMALLGAKRPQHRAWQFIVLTLLVVLALPAGESLLPGRGAVTLHFARAVFLLILVAVGAFNGLGTRYWLASLTLAAGQLLLLADYGPWFEKPLVQSWSVFGVGLVILSLLLAALISLVGRRRARGWDRVWIDFRNLYGAVWGLRVMERANAAMPVDQPTRLTWRGFSGPVHEGQTQAVRPLLRRFVSSAWIDQRLDASV